MKISNVVETAVRFKDIRVGQGFSRRVYNTATREEEMQVGFKIKMCLDGQWKTAACIVDTDYCFVTMFDADEIVQPTTFVVEV